jgi:hypothetical protein
MARRHLHCNSQRMAHEQTQVVKALQEGLGGIRLSYESDHGFI